MANVFIDLKLYIKQIKYPLMLLPLPQNWFEDERYTFPLYFPNEAKKHILYLKTIA